MARRVASKLEEGDFKGAVRLASSPVSFCPEDERTLKLLKERHPPPHEDTVIPPFQVSEHPLEVSSSVVLEAISSFPAGSAGGPDGLRPQHLKDMVYSPSCDGYAELISTLTDFVNMVLAGRVTPAARPFFFGASLVGLLKNDAGVRPIAVGCTLRRLVAKCASAMIKSEMGSLLYPVQLGYDMQRSGGRSTCCSHLPFQHGDRKSPTEVGL